MVSKGQYCSALEFLKMYQLQLGNGTGKPTGIAPATRTRPMAYLYLQLHRFTRQKEPKNVQNGPELKDIGPISMNFTKSVISPSVLVQKIRFWACSKAHRYHYCNLYPYPEPGPGYSNLCHSL